LPELPELPVYLPPGQGGPAIRPNIFRRCREGPPGGGRICWGHSTCCRASYTAKDAESRQKAWLRILGPKSVDNAIYCDVCKCATLTEGERRFIPLPLELPPLKLLECGQEHDPLHPRNQPSRIDIPEGAQSQKRGSKPLPCPVGRGLSRTRRRRRGEGPCGVLRREWTRLHIVSP
jgi:hypothetical protein